MMIVPAKSIIICHRSGFRNRGDGVRSRTVIIIKRSLSPGFAGIDNPLFYEDKTMMLFADGKAGLEAVVAALVDV